MTGPTIAGIDVSNWQGPAFGWLSYKGQIGFAFAKASEGLTFTDPDFARNWQQMQAIGITRGAYHYAHPGESAAAQASYFLGIVKSHGLGTGDLLALDLETNDGLSPSQVAAWAVLFCDAIRSATTIWPFVYANGSYIGGGYCTGCGMAPLWYANPSNNPIPPGPWTFASIEQTGVRGVDLDTFYGAPGQLAKLGIPAPAPVVSPPVPPAPPAITKAEAQAAIATLSKYVDQ